MKYYKLKIIAFYIFATTIISFELKGSDSITRKKLEEIMFSLNFYAHDDEDIQFLNNLYNNNQADMYIFRFTDTKIYFEIAIISYCKEHWKEIKEEISDENIKNEFILNFGEADNKNKENNNSSIEENKDNSKKDNEGNNKEENKDNSKKDNKGCCSCCYCCKNKEKDAQINIEGTNSNIDIII